VIVSNHDEIVKIIKTPKNPHYFTSKSLKNYHNIK